MYPPYPARQGGTRFSNTTQPLEFQKLTLAHFSALHFSPFKWNVSDLIDFQLDLSLHLHSTTSINLAEMQLESYWFLYPWNHLEEDTHFALTVPK